MLNIEVIIWYIALLDSIIANIIAWFFMKWYKKYKLWHKILPITKVWCLWYLILVLWIGFALYRLGII